MSVSQKYKDCIEESDFAGDWNDEDITPMPKRIDELPRELLRKIVEPLGPKDRCNVRLCNRVMEETVATSKAHFDSARIVYSQGVLDISHKTERLYSNVYRDEHWRNRLFEKLSVEYLSLEDIRPTSKDMPVVNSFVDNCSFDSLTVNLSQIQWPCSRIYELIRKAVKKVELSWVNLFTPIVEQFLSISRPATFYVREKWKPQDEFFVELLRRGHSFSDFVFMPQSQYSLMESIKIVSKAVIAQRVFIFVSNKDLCQHLLNNSDMLDEDTLDCKDYTEYCYLGAWI